MFPGEQIKRTIIYDMLLIFIVFLHQIKRFSYPYPTLKKWRVHRGGGGGGAGGGGQSPSGKWI